jgi:hypothetical protein
MSDYEDEGERDDSYEAADVTPKKKENVKINEDNVLQIIDLEFSDVSEWLKGEMKKSKLELKELIDSLKIKYEN